MCKPSHILPLLRATRSLHVTQDKSLIPHCGRQGFTLSRLFPCPHLPYPCLIPVMPPLPSLTPRHARHAFVRPEFCTTLLCLPPHSCLSGIPVQVVPLIWSSGLNTPQFAHGKLPLSPWFEGVSHLRNKPEQLDTFCQEFGSLTE